MCDDFKAQIQYLVYDLWKILIIKENSMKNFLWTSCKILLKLKFHEC